MNKENWRRHLPNWMRERIEVNTFLMKDLLATTAQTLPTESFVLDAGAGEGRFRDLFAHTRYLGVDLAVGDLAWDYSGLDIITPLERLCFADATFDVVVFTQVMEHVSEPSLVLAELRRVLRPGGMLILVAPQSWHEHQIPHDYYRYTSYGLRYLLAKNGYEVETIQPLGGYFWYLAFQLQLLPYWLFSRNHFGNWLGTLRPFLKASFVVIFEVLLPLILFYLDRLDRVQEATLGHFCIAHARTPSNQADLPNR